jgi:hypothetical protein
MDQPQDLQRLLAALKTPQTIQDHPDWEAFKQVKFPQFLSFYYTNQEDQETYWDNARIIRLDLKKLHLIIEGAHGDPLKFEIPRIMHAKNTQTGEKVQHIFFELHRMWNGIHQPLEDENLPDSAN